MKPRNKITTQYEYENANKKLHDKMRNNPKCQTKTTNPNIIYNNPDKNTIKDAIESIDKSSVNEMQVDTDKTRNRMTTRRTRGPIPIFAGESRITVRRVQIHRDAK